MDSVVTHTTHDDEELSLAYEATATDQLSPANPDDALMLTTIDNPFSPKLEYDKWRQWDIDNLYHTEEYLARLTDIPSNVDIDDELTITRLTTHAIYEILEHDVLGIYVLV